jgi:hypothetical protein
MSREHDPDDHGASGQSVRRIASTGEESSDASEGFTLHCYDEKPEGDPHAIKIELDSSDADRFRLVEVGPHRGELWVEVSDLRSGRRFFVASAPCGLGCHCAAVAVPISG